MLKKLILLTVIYNKNYIIIAALKNLLATDLHLAFANIIS